jgi:hypothetical protein
MQKQENKIHLNTIGIKKKTVEVIKLLQQY